MSLSRAKSKKKEAPQFFCDSCGTEVGQEVSKCPTCGKGFASVRCPACDFVGEVERFENGCPSCGYSLTTAPDKKTVRQEGAPPRDALHALPLWVYLLTGAAFVGVLYGLAFIVTH